MKFLASLWRARCAPRRVLVWHALNYAGFGLREWWVQRSWMSLRVAASPAQLVASVAFGWIEGGLVELDDDYWYFASPWWAAA